MIDCKDLRIGNWVYSPEDENVIIESVKKDWCDVRTKGDGEFHESYGCPTQNLEPIPLTPELLVKCGFEIVNSDVHNITHAYNGYLAINTYTEGGEYWWLRYYQGGTNINIKYLHQLQNIYYLLIGKELEIDLI